MHNSIFTLIEILGTISFSISGVISGMKEKPSSRGPDP